MPARQGNTSHSPSLTDRIRRLFLMIELAREKNGIPLMLFKGARLVYLRITRKIHRLLRHREYRRRVAELVDLIERQEGFFDLLHIPVGWNTPMFQRYQHLSLQFARLGGFVLYGGHPDVDRDLFVYETRIPNLYVFDATDRGLVENIVSTLRQNKRSKIVRIQSIDMRTTLSEISRFMDQGFTVIYEYIDILSTSITGIVPAFISARHERILEDERILVIATAEKLKKEVLKRRTENYLLNTNGVDVDHWKNVRADPPYDLRDMLLTGRTIIGYHGALAEWIDYDLLWEVVRTGRYELLLLGLEHDSSLKRSGLAGHPRVHFLGRRSYFELNQYARYYDIAILPFRKSRLTDSISPVKIFEYMAAQKPVVTTDLMECTKYASCLISHSTEEFLENLERARVLKEDPRYLALLESESRDNSWHQKAVEILKFAGVILD